MNYVLFFKQSTLGVSTVCYSPDGKYLVSSSMDKTIRIWNAEKKYELIKIIHSM